MPIHAQRQRRQNGPGHDSEVVTAVEPPSTEAVTVSLENQSGLEVKDEQLWADVARSTLCREGVLDGHLDILLVASDVMSKINAEHMGVSKPTDVLAFPMDAPNLADAGVNVLEITGVKDGPPLHLGDIVICPEVAIAQAPNHSGTIESEYCLLTIHAVLHILGHDHAEENERVAMQGRERLHMSAHGYQHPLRAELC